MHLVKVTPRSSFRRLKTISQIKKIINFEIENTLQRLNSVSSLFKPPYFFIQQAEKENPLVLQKLKSIRMD